MPEGECNKCDGSDTEEMVSCDDCQAWFHFECVGESPGVEERPFQCEKCAAKKDQMAKKAGKPDPNMPLKNASFQPPDATDQSTSVEGHMSTIPQGKRGSFPTSKMAVVDDGKLSANESATVESRMQLALLRLEQKMAQEEEELAIAKAIRKRQIECERILAERQLQQEKELNELKLVQERAMLEKRLTEQEEYRRRQNELRKEFERRSSSLSLDAHEYHAASDYRLEKTLPDMEIESKLGAVPKVRPSFMTDGETPKRPPQIKPLTLNTDPPESNSEGEVESTVSSHDDASLREKRTETGSRFELGPTRAQRSARQVLSKKLPVFSGKSEEWPLFYSSFVNSTEACGFTEVENLIRLQECLKGPALESVRSRLLLPAGVPQVIATLRMLYGRPEQLIYSLQQKVRRTDPPRADKLDTFIPFGMAVQELCDHLEAADSKDHLVNPSLIQEMVDKLPAPTKREWVQYKRFSEKVTLRTFAEFISIIVKEASEVTLVVESRLPSYSRTEKPRARERAFVHTHFLDQKETSPSASKPFPICRICEKDGHRIRNCDEFRRMKPQQRLAAIQNWRLCERCLNEHEGWCKFKITCNVGSCRHHHHPLAHREVYSSTNLPSSAMPANSSAGQHHAHLASKLTVIFRIVPVTIHIGSKSVTTCAYLDEGSDMTLIEDSLVRELGAVGKPQPLTLKWTGNIVRQEPASQCLSLKIQGGTEGRLLHLADAHTVKKLYLPQQTVNFKEVIDQYQHLRGLCAEEQVGEEPRLLIGLNNIYLFAPLESRIGGVDEPIAVRSYLGWTIYGPKRVTPARGFLAAHGGLTNQQLHDQMREYFATEDCGAVAEPMLESEADRRAKLILQNTTVRIGYRFETGLLWRSDDCHLPDNYQMAFKRLCSLERRLKKNPVLEEAVKQQIESYQEKQYAHVATQAELREADPTRIWYLPLNVVLNPKKQNKVRLVWDAAAQVNGVSLNSQLLAGPDLLTSLPAVVQLFRQLPVAFVGDICEMYHQLRIRKEDKHSQRFLYRTDPAAPPDVFLMDVATFGSACSPASAQYVKNLNASQHADLFPAAAKAIVCNHYVDDYLDSVSTEEEAIERAKQVRQVHSKAGFVIRNWVSNSEKFMREMGETEHGEKIALHQSTSAGAERVLGIVWYPKEDVFRFSITIRDDLMPYLTTHERPTKRIALSCIMSLFDPLGLLALFTIHGKIIIQDLWRLGYDWDDKIDDGSYKKWTQWRLLLPQIEQVSIPRCYLQGAPPEAYGSLQLHVFVDASEQAYGCVAYFRLVTEGGVKCALVMAKTKVASLKQISIPRMELNAAVLGARMLNRVCANHELKVTKRVIWSDSRTVLSWIRSEQRKYKPFVAFRIGEILQETKLDEWRWIPTKLNIADLLTKWGNGPCLESMGPWFCGPYLICGPEDLWPAQPLTPPDTTEELRTSHLYHTAVISEPLIDVSRISRWNVLLRTACCVIRFISNCRRKVQRMPIEVIDVPANMLRSVVKHHDSVHVPLKQTEYEKAEHILWKQAQSEYYADEIATLQRNRELPKEKWLPIEKSSALYHLEPFLDEFNVLRVSGRIEAAEYVPYDTRFPIILPRKHPITERVIEHYHQRYGHCYRETVVNELRQRFHISTIRASVSGVMKRCQECKIRKCKPITPKMAPLPVERLTPYCKPFSYVGLD
ncbi:uncharacterized protein LOC131680319 [Topomyia yanbarensis]|uniref:uncharacterized protein LOC131680319 n=1 Tax=Topomyia yanbarensis TaxID=2498891 RepID=UPI00273CDA8D|nr:uncharacterized protein LOC131680319 [Topomyia yanbarensis]